MESELRKDSGKISKKYDNLSLRMKSDDTKVGHDKLVEKFKIQQRRVFPFLRESKREADVDIEDTEEVINDEYESDTERKEIEEELEGEEIEKILISIPCLVILL